MYNKRLQIQLQKYVGEKSLPKYFIDFLSAVNSSYDNFEQTQKTLEQTIESGSKQLIDLKQSHNKAHDRLKSMIDNIEEVFFSIQFPDFKLLQMSPACEKVYGYTKTDFRQNSKLWYELVLIEDKYILDDIYPTMQAGNSFTREYRINHKNGSTRWLETKITPTLDKDGKLIRIDGVTADITNRKKAEIAIAESENKYRSLFEKMVDGIYKSSHEGKFLEVNPALVNMLGYDSKEELLGINIKSQLYFDPNDRDEAIYQDKMDGISIFRLKKKDGSEIWVEDRGQYVSDEKGKMLYHEGILRDVTERIKGEFQLQKSQKETSDYRKALDQSLIVSITDQNGIIIYANDNFCKISKYTSDDIIGKDHRFLNTGCQTEEYINLVWETISNGNVWRGEDKNKAKDGTFYWVDTTIIPFLNKYGKPYQYLSIRTDITERKNAEIKIAESEENFRTIIQSSYDLIQSVNREGQFEFVNDSWLKTLGYTREDLPKLNLFNVISEEHFNLCINEFQKVFKGEALDNIKTIFISKSGKEVILEGNAVPRFKNNKIIATQSFFRDVTEREKADKDLKANIEELRKSNSELDKFVYSVSHDLRAPLCSMNGVIEIAQEDTTDELILEHFKMLQGNIKKLDGFIADIIDYSRNSRIEIRKEKINIKEFLNDVTLNLKFMSSYNRKVKINIDVNDNAVVHTDKSRLNIILNNLVSNAIRYQNSHISDPFVNIKIDTSDTETDIIIRDNGIGIKKELQQKIFDMFYRISEDSVGSGLGLYIVKEAVNKLNGKIEVVSEIGTGSTFIIKIPNS